MVAEQIEGVTIEGPGDEEVQIWDRIYNVKEFLRKHPGGTIIKSKLGNDATEAFQEFHFRSKRAHNSLKKLPNRPGVPCEDALVKDFNKLREELIEEGYFEPNYLHVIYRIVEILFMCWLGYQFLLNGYFLTGMTIIGLAAGRSGWIQHEANHNSLTCNMLIDKTIGSFFFSVGEAGSARWWIRSHNRHHASPQHIGYDADLNTLPLVAFDKVTGSLGHPGWMRYQAFGFIPSTWLVVLFWKLYLHPMAIIKKRAINDFAFLVLHYYLFYKYFMFLGWPKMILAHLVWGSVQGMYLFTNFALSHTHKPVILKHESEDWVRSAIFRTVNIETTWWCNWWMGYLNCQIEHHLFPNMPQFRHPRVVPKVKELCKKHGIFYDERGYFQTVYDMFHNLHVVGNSEVIGTGKGKKSKKLH